MTRVIHRFLVYVTRDVKGPAKYPNTLHFCNNHNETLKFRIRFNGPFTKTGLEGYVKYIRLVRNNEVIVGSDHTESQYLKLGPSECLDFDVEYYIDERLSEDLDYFRVKMIINGLLPIGGFQFDVVTD
ncbi:hypothetical protein [Vulcanisaeta thermophila]|uniref:hypothetical protein n=1 Tax=Vulcanisaeta thermophila TaxID=867917 RepID=UPI00085331E3|nr:hypothetical protein [Vulcanisaeta thermophila]